MAQTMSLREFLDDYGLSLAEKVSDDMEVIHDPLRDAEPDMDSFMDGLLKDLFPYREKSSRVSSRHSETAIGLCISRVKWERGKQSRQLYRPCF